MLRLSAAERALISARIDQSMAGVSDASDSNSPASSPEPQSPLPLEQPDLTQSAAWQEYVAAKTEMDKETEDFYTEWKQELKEIKRTYVPTLIPETPLEDQRSSSDSFEALPDPPSPSDLSENPSFPSENPENPPISSYETPENSINLSHFDEIYIREAENSKMMEEDDLSSLLFMYFTDLQKQKVEKEKKRIHAENRKSQEIRLKAQLAEIDIDKKRKKEEMRQIEETKKREEIERINRENEEKRSQEREKSAMRAEEMYSKAAERHIEETMQLQETETMRKQDDYSHILRQFPVFKHTKPEFLSKNRAKRITFAEINCGTVQSLPKSHHFLYEITPISVPESFPIPPFQVIPDIPPSADSPTPLSDSLPYDISSKTISLTLKCENISHINGLFSLSNLHFLYLSMNKITEAVNLPQGLIFLDLSLNKIANLPKSDLPALKELILDSNVIFSLENCGNYRNLRVFSAQNNNISAINGIERFPLLQRLNLYRNNLSTLPKNSFSANSFLTHVNFGRNKLKIIEFHSNLPLLRSLILYENQISTITELNSPLLHELWLNGNQLKSVNFLKNVNLMEILRLDQNIIEEICDFEAENLVEVNISDNNIGDLKVINTILKAGKRIKSFEFNDNPIWKRLENIGWNRKFEGKCEKNEGKNAVLRRIGFEYSQSEIWLRAISRNEIRSEELKEKIWIFTQNLAIFHYNSLGNSAELEVLAFESLSYLYKEHLYKLRKAAKLIQNWWSLRVKKLRKLREIYSRHLKEIIQIQAFFRGVISRKKYVFSRYPVSIVVRIQAWYRGCRLRKRLQSALLSAKFVDPELAELEEVEMDDYEDLDLGLKVPAYLDLRSFVQPVQEQRLPRITGQYAGLGETRGSWNRPGSEDRSDTKSVKSSVPQLPSAKREQVKQALNAWGFQGEDVKRAFNHRLAKRKARKMKEKETTADERLARFHRFCS